MNIFIKLTALTVFALTAMGGPARAWNPNTHENLIVFDGEGEVMASYHMDDMTTSVVHDGGDSYTVNTDTYSTTVTDPPSANSKALTIENAAGLVPNVLSGTFPAPPAGLPDVSLFGFDDALLDATNSASTGITCSPSAGTYDQTISVSLKASPSTALVEYSLDGGTTWVTGANAANLYIYQTTTMLMRVSGSTPSTSVAYVIARIDGMSALHADTDNDGFPDCWEIAHGMNPLSNDRNMDSDGDGFSDFDEILRGTDPQDGASRPVDNDGDGWSAFDENLRGTSDNDPLDKPVAQGLYEPERLLSGTLYQDDLKTLPIDSMEFTIRTLASVTVSQGTCNALGQYGIPALRLRAGDPLVVRGAGAVNDNFAVKRYLPLLKDLAPEDIDDTTWTSPEEWQTLFLNYLQTHLVVTESEFDITPGHIQPLALLERELELYQGLPEGLFILTGTLSHGPYPGTMTDFGLLLATKFQSMNEHIQDLEQILDASQTCYGLKDQIAALYTQVSGTDETSLEKQIGSLLQSEHGLYLASLMLTSTFEEIQNSGTVLCSVISPDSDNDGDGISNADELVLGTDPDNADTDGDTINDGMDNCPLIANTDQADSDLDTIGDVCDDDRDGDGVDNDVEIALGLNPDLADSDGDGQSDYDEWLYLTTPPGKPTITSPVTGALNVASTLTIQADAFSDYPGDAHQASIWQISSDPAFADNHALVFEADTDDPTRLTEITVPAFILTAGSTYAVRVLYKDSALLESLWSDPVTFTVVDTGLDSDMNGIPDDQEVDGSVDTDGDSTPDVDQPEDIKCVNTVIDATVHICIKRHLNVAFIESVQSVDPATIADTVNRPDELPAGLVVTRFSTEAPGDRAEILVVFSQPLMDGSRWYRYDELEGWADYPGQSDGPDINNLILQITDGGPGDSDGVVNGVIVTTGGINLPLDSVTTPGDGGGDGGGGGCFIQSSSLR